MSIGEYDSRAALSPDFARRVVQQVRIIRGRRHIRRRIVAGAVTCAAAALILLSLQPHRYSESIIEYRNTATASPLAAPSIESVPARGSAIVSINQPLAFFFPGAATIEDFRSLSDASWHPYDSWWEPGYRLGYDQAVAEMDR